MDTERKKDRHGENKTDHPLILVRRVPIGLYSMISPVSGCFPRCPPSVPGEDSEDLVLGAAFHEYPDEEEDSTTSEKKSLSRVEDLESRKGEVIVMPEQLSFRCRFL